MRCVVQILASNIRDACVRARAAAEQSGNSQRLTVVAVLGMAHVNGIQRILASDGEEGVKIGVAQGVVLAPGSVPAPPI